MAEITYRKAQIEDCYSIAELKGIVWNSGYNKFCVGVNKQNLNAIKFYEAMSGKQICTDDKQIKIEFKVE